MRVALTGAASGIGAEVAARLKEDGHHVTAFDLADPGAGVDRWIPVDLSDAAAIDRAVAGVEGPFEALINNAGLPPRDGLQEQILALNFFGLRRFLEGMLPAVVLQHQQLAEQAALRAHLVRGTKAFLDSVTLWP